MQNLQARLSQLRLALKAKAKRKSNALRAMFKSGIAEGDHFDNTIKSLSDVKFETSEDFQNYFEISRQLVKMIQIDTGGEGMSQQAIENNFMSNDFKTEMDILKIIKEMSDLSARINNRVIEHNRTSSQKLEKIDPIVFAAMTEVNRVFKGEDSTGSTGSSNSAA